MSPKSKSFSKRLSIYVITITAILLLGVIALVSYFTSKIMYKESKQTAENELKSIIADINGMLSSVEASVNNIAWLVDDKLNTPDAMYELTEKLVSRNEMIVGSAIAFLPYYYSEKGYYFSPYTCKDHQKGTIKSFQMGNEDYDYPSMEWFQYPQLTKKPVWNEPYFDDGSGAVDNMIGTALRTYFGYSKSVSYIEKKNYVTEDWIKLMTEELDNSRPVIYGAWDSHHDFGHELILDGYAKKSDTDVMFHINWGWNGDCDGYYAISALNPDNAYTNNDNVNDFYDSNHVATIKIQKPTSAEDPDVEEWSDVGWSDNWSDFGTGVWYDVYINSEVEYALRIRTNNTYPYMKQIKVVAWNAEQVIQNMNKAQATYTYTKDVSDIDLIFNWNTALNICFMPDKQYMGISQSQQYSDTKNIYYRNAETGSEGRDTDNGLYNVSAQTFTIDFVRDFLNTRTNKFDTEDPENNFSKTTARLTIGGAFYLRNFTESDNGETATQEACIYDCSYFRTKLVPVEDIIGKVKISNPDNLISYYKNLADVIHFTDIEDYLDATAFSSWISEDSEEVDEEDGDYYITYNVPAEGAYYAIVVFTDETGTIKGCRKLKKKYQSGHIHHRLSLSHIPMMGQHHLQRLSVNF